MGTLRAWWQRLKGGDAKPPGVAPRPVRPRKDNDPDPGLSLVDDPLAKPRSRGRTAGFDPYSSDGGYSKPHSWERLDHD